MVRSSEIELIPLWQREMAIYSKLDFGRHENLHKVTILVLAFLDLFEGSTLLPLLVKHTAGTAHRLYARRPEGCDVPGPDHRRHHLSGLRFVPTRRSIGDRWVPGARNGGPKGRASVRW